MKKELSIYLDLVRFAAAFVVLVHHSNIRTLTTDHLPFYSHGPAAVIVFFLLSGYVISYVTSTRENTPIEYWASRLSRFYPLIIPVVLLTPFLDLVGEALAPHFYQGKTTHDFWWLRTIASLTFLNELWNVSIMSFSNVPFWSLCYEMWYYIVFGIVLFTNGYARIILVSASVLVIGPKIIALAPIWVLGVVLHRYQPLYRIPQWQGWLLFLASWPCYALFQHYQLPELGSAVLKGWIGEKWHRDMAFSKFFLADYILALIIAANFVGFRAIASCFSRPLFAAEGVIRWLSSYTFVLYIFHQPLLLFFGALYNGDPNGKVFYAAVVGSTLLTVLVIGTIAERARPGHRAFFRLQLFRLTGTKWWRNVITAPLAYRRERI